MTDGSETGGRVARWMYRLLLLAYPSSFRTRFGRAMTYAFERDAESARRRGAPTVLGLWTRTLLTMPIHGLLERIESSSGTRRATIAWEGGERMGEMLREVRLALRNVLRRPGFAVPAIGALALGIGGTTAMFSVLDGVVLRPLPYADAEGLVALGHASPSGTLGMPAAGYLHYVQRSQTLDGIAVYVETTSAVATLEEPLELGMIVATPSLLDVLGVEPILGRGLTDADTEPGAAPVALVTHGYWTRRLGADPNVLGRPVVEGDDTHIVGVLPEGFSFLRPEATVVFGNRFEEPDVIVPLERFDPSGLRFGNFIYQGLGRLAPGRSAAEAQAELQALVVEAAEAFPGGIEAGRIAAGEYRPRVQALQASIVDEVAGVLWTLMAAVGVVLVIAIANVANLILVRTESRSMEIAIRRAIGAGRSSLVRTFLAEGLVLSAIGGVVGIVLAGFGTGVLLRLAPVDVPRVEGVGLDARALGVALGLALFTGLVSGVAPLLRQRGSQHAALGDGSRGGTASRSRLRARGVLVGAQVALALVLLVSSGLLVRTFQNLRDVDPGFDPSHVATLRLSLSGSILRAAGHADGNADARRSRYMLELMDRVAAVPGVRSASFSADLPLDGDAWRDYVATEDAIPAEQSDAVRALRVFMGPGYLNAIGAGLVSGREFDRQDFADQPRVAVVNEAFARERWPGLDPVGRRLAQYWSSFDADGDIWYTVVGVVRDVRETSLMTPPEPTVYLPTVFLPDGGFAMFVSNLVAVVRTEEDPLLVLPSIRREIQAFQSVVPINDVETLEELTARSFQALSFAMVLVLVAAGMALLLGLTGIYGTVLYAVSQRTREFGVRMALGASASDIRAGVLRQGVVLGLEGVGVGLIGARAATRLLESLLFGVTTSDPLVYASVASALLVLVLGASLVPAHRAAAVDPLVSMRAE